MKNSFVKCRRAGEIGDDIDSYCGKEVMEGGRILVMPATDWTRKVAKAMRLPAQLPKHRLLLQYIALVGAASIDRICGYGRHQTNAYGLLAASSLQCGFVSRTTLSGMRMANISYPPNGTFLWLQVTGLLLVALLLVKVDGEPTGDKEALLDFINKVPHGRRLNWNANTSACSWVGVICNSNKDRIWTLRLPGVGLFGQIPSDTLGRLTELRVLSLRSNRLAGPLPSDLANLKVLRSLYVQHNLLSGPLPPSLPVWTRLNRLDLSFNRFNGTIPFSLNNLTHLTALYLQNNSLSGSIPNLNIPNLTIFSVASNKLNGSIPRSLQKFPKSSFQGNAVLCGTPLAQCRAFFPSPSPSPSVTVPPPKHKKSQKLSTGVIVAIVVGVAALLFLLSVALFLCYVKRQKTDRSTEKPQKTERSTVEKGGPSKDEYMSSAQEAERNKLVFFEGSQYTFDLEDLLRASAEVLGKGSVGTAYKAVLEDGTTVVVKRLKDVAASRKDFEQQMELVGRIRHRNLVPLRAFYFSKDEKLLVYDYMLTGSLSALLHGICSVFACGLGLQHPMKKGLQSESLGSRGSGRTPLDWDTRMRIALGAARGVSHIHEEGGGGKFTHGNIKSSNVLLTSDLDACVSDFGLVPLFSSAAAANRIAGYRAPEVVETRKVTQKSDVYSFGVLLLELLTGKAPNQASLNDEGIDLPRWVQSVVREEWTAEVFDVELMRYQNIEEEMVQLLQIAMACVATVPDQRPRMQDVVKMIEDMRQFETDDGNRQSSDDKSKESNGHTPPQQTTPEARTPSAITP
eukprot:Gb_32503 [translate_table: standard]